MATTAIKALRPPRKTNGPMARPTPSMRTQQTRRSLCDATIAKDREYYGTRLDDPSLLNFAVELQNGRLAVPVGGRRHGGYDAPRDR